MIKDKLYEYFVRKNGRVCYEYERYVREHIQEHHLHRFEHIKLLIKLNWFYRVKKGNTPYLYWDTPLNPAEKPKNQNNQRMPTWKSNAFWGSESKSYSSWKEVHLVKRFLEYDYAVFDVFDTLVYIGIRSRREFYKVLEREFHISQFSELRERAEKEAIGKAKFKKKEATIEDIYRQLHKYTGIDIEEGVAKEIAVLKKLSYPNAYMKQFFEMLSYSMDGIVVIGNTYYSSAQIRDILADNGYTGIKDIYISNEICAIGENILPFISDTLSSGKIIYMGVDKKKNDMAKKCGWDIWEYRNATSYGNKYRPTDISGTKADSYCAIINQHMYSGHYQHSQRRELGYTYFGILTIGFLNWVKKSVRENDIARIEFISGTSGIMHDTFDRYFNRDEMISDTLLFSEEMAVRCLVDLEPFCFLEYYIERKITGNYTVSFYIDRMGLERMVGRLAEYGIKATDIVKQNGDVYWAFLDFIGDNLADIKSQYEDEICAVCQYLQSKKYENVNIGVINIRGRGYIAKALRWLLNERLNKECDVKEFTVFQVLPFEDAVYIDGTVKAFIYGRNLVEGFNLPVNIGQGNYLESIFVDKMPRLCVFYLNEIGQYQIKFDDAYPWRYGAITEIQRGVKDFICDYMLLWENNLDMCSFSAEEIISVLRNVTTNNDYLKENIPIVLV